MNYMFLLGDILLLVVNLIMCYTNYQGKRYKTAIFSAYAAGFISFAAIALIAKMITS